MDENVEQEETSEEPKLKMIGADDEVPDGTNEMVIKGDIKKFIESIKAKEGSEVCSFENKNLGISVELVSRKYDVVELSNIALQMISASPIQLTGLRYIG